MDLDTLMQNLRLTRPRSRSPPPAGEVTLQVLPHHTEKSYHQIDASPGEDVSRRWQRFLWLDPQPPQSF